MQHSFFQRVFMTIMSGAVAAGLILFYQHVIARSIYENSNEGWRDMFKDAPARR